MITKVYDFWLTIGPLLCHHHLLLLSLLSNDLARKQLGLRRALTLGSHVCAVVSHLAVAHRAHHAGVVEALRAVIGVAKILLKILWWLIVTIWSIIQLHVSCLVRNAAARLKIQILNADDSLKMH